MRRAFSMSWALLFLSLSPGGLGPAEPLARNGPPPILVLVGEVAAERATLWVRATGEGPVRVRWEPLDGPAAPRSVEIGPEGDADATARVHLAVEPGTRYAYTVSQGPETVRGTFASAPAPDDDVPVNLMWSADLGGGGHCRDVEDGYPIFRAMERRGPDFFLFLGDTIYADHLCGERLHVPGADFVATMLDEYRAKHLYNRADPAVQDFLRTTSVYAIWDDHEVTNNFSGPHEPLMPIGRRAFLDYFPIEGPPSEPTRLYRSRQWGRHLEIFVLDTRQYRSRNTERDGPTKTMLGVAQRDWLLGRLLASTATWKIVVTSVPLGMFTGGSVSDSWSDANVFGFRRPGVGFVRERDLILGTLGSAAVPNVVFLSGDVHHAELIRHEPSPGWVVHEFVAGPLAARLGYPRPLDRSLHSRSLGSLGFAANFGEIVADRDHLTVRILDAVGATRVSLRLPSGA